MRAWQAEQGQCFTNPDFMLTNCQLSCKCDDPRATALRSSLPHTKSCRTARAHRECGPDAQDAHLDLVNANEEEEAAVAALREKLAAELALADDDEEEEDGEPLKDEM